MWENNKIKIVVVLIILVSFVFYGSTHNWDFAFSVRVKEEVKKENFVLQKIDVTKVANEDKLPTGFLKDIPVELKNVTESNTLIYTDKGVTLYSVAYSSIKKMAEKEIEYRKYLSKNGFTIKNTIKQTSLINLEATKDKDTIAITITSKEGGSFVQIAYVYRK